MTVLVFIVGALVGAAVGIELYIRITTPNLETWREARARERRDRVGHAR